MAGLILTVNSGEVALIAATPKTVLQIKAPANHRLKLRNVKLFGKQPAGGVDTPVKVRLTRSTASFGTGSAATPGKIDPAMAETVQSTAAANFTVEPTSPTDTGVEWEVQPQSGVIEPQIPGQELVIPGGQALNFEATSVATPTVLFTATYEE